MHEFCYDPEQAQFLVNNETLTNFVKHQYGSSQINEQKVSRLSLSSAQIKVPRDELGFEGVICTDWGVITGRIWGVEPLTVEERYLKSSEAGVDQYGGES